MGLPSPNHHAKQSIDRVKGAKVLYSKDKIIITHYDTPIVIFNWKDGQCKCNWDCSPTSNRQIMYFLRAMDIDEEDTINTHIGSKWNYSRGL